MENSEVSARIDILHQLVQRLRAGDESAREELLGAAGERLMILTHKLKRNYARVGRWEQTEDVYQGAVLRLHKALASTDINDVQHFLRLAAVQIRRELIDLARKHQGAEGLAANYLTQAGQAGQNISPHGMAFDPAELTRDPAAVQEWSELHELIEQLPEEQRSVVDLILYHGLPQAEAAEVLSISVRSVKRQWRAARMLLYEKLRGEFPGE